MQNQLVGELRPPLARGLQWLEQGDHSLNYGGGWPGYTLYGIERVGLASGFKYFGKHDWYLDGYKTLLSAQKGDGSWDKSHFIKPTWDTCFAILFLKRSTRPLVASTVERR